MDVFDKFKNVKVLIVGDVMLDKYLWGDVNRISPEAPVPVVSLRKIDYAAGGAANVAANVAGLGAKPFLIGLIGSDEGGEKIPEILENSGVSAEYLIKFACRRTTVKTRIIAHNQQIVRIDEETTEKLTEKLENQVWQEILKILDIADVVVISDYGKGLMSRELVMRLIMKAKQLGKIILVDPKGKDYSKYRGATIVTPNKFEAAEIGKLSETDELSLVETGNQLLKELDLNALLITRGEEGMTLFQQNAQPIHLKAMARHVFDVTGAGDTVIAAMAAGLGAGESFVSSAELSNIAAGLVVSEVGTTRVNVKDLKIAVKEYSEIS